MMKRKIFKFLKKKLWSICYKINFEDGYQYKMISSSNLKLLEMRHFLLLMDGWERATDIKVGSFFAFCWYRK